ncbi:MAG: ABC transporter permease [Treponemataceae bacterium]
MKLRFAFIYALRCLGFGNNNSESNARKTLIGAVLGIGISLIPLVLVLVVSDGMISGITSRLVELDSGHIKLIKLRVRSDENDGRNEKELKEKICKTYAHDNFFENAWVERSGTGLLIGNDGRSGGTIRAIEKNFFEENKKAKALLRVIEGEAVLKEDNEILLGKKIAENLKLKVNDTCRILTLRNLKNGKTLPKFTSFKVKGIISCGYQELDALWVFISLEQGLKILQGSSSLTSLIVSTADPFDNSRFAKFLFDLNQNLTEDFMAYSWQNLNRSQSATFETTKNLLIFIMFLILFVASVNISSALIMLVLERNKEIAILKSTGASGKLITLSFFIAGLLTSFLGMLVGLPIGVLLGININKILEMIENFVNLILIFVYKLLNINTNMLDFNILNPSFYLENIPVKLKLDELLLLASMVVLLSVIVSIIPSSRAGKEKPLDIMRKL